MKNTKLFITLLVIAVSLITAAAVFAGGPPPGWCAKCCAQGGPCTGCSCSSGGGGEEQVVYIRPQDKIGEYYVDANGKRIYTSFRTWAECMNNFNDAKLCSRIVTDSCESCRGFCKYNGNNDCNDTCKNACLNRPVYETEDQKELPGGEDTYGKYHYEKGRKIYDELKDLAACWFVMGDMNLCVNVWGYDCKYAGSYYASEMCNNWENECWDRVKSEYADACK
jgi:hypothetical protein